MDGLESHKITDVAMAKHFVFAGNSLFTLKSLKSDRHVTFKVKVPKNMSRGTPSTITHFVSVRDDADGIGSYSYLGTINEAGAFNHGRKSLVAHDHWRTNAARWLFDHLAQDKLPARAELWHEGRCGRCGRVLTHPESIASGIGPECLKKEGASPVKKTSPTDRRDPGTGLVPRPTPTGECRCCAQFKMGPKGTNARSRYAEVNICSDCGQREALEGFFWKRKALADAVALNAAGVAAEAQGDVL